MVAPSMPDNSQRHVRQFDFRLGYDPGVRVRNHIETVEGQMVHFALTLEYEIAPNDWRPVVRYDTTGGQVHRDRLNRDRSYRTHRESIRLGLDISDALTNARKDVVQNYERYIRDF